MGCTRIVLILKKIVIKIPNFTYSWENFLKGLIANITERNSWEYANIPDSYNYRYRDLLCPIIWSSWGAWIVIMKRARVLTDEEYLSTNLKIHKYYYAGDDKSDNYGYLNGKIVKIDYGS